MKRNILNGQNMIITPVIRYNYTRDIYKKIIIYFNRRYYCFVRWLSLTIAIKTKCASVKYLCNNIFNVKAKYSIKKNLKKRKKLQGPTEI